MASATAARSRVARFDDEGLVTGEAVTLDVRPASALIRAAGSAIDVLLSLLLIVALLLSLAGLSVDEAAFRATRLAGFAPLEGVILIRGCATKKSHREKYSAMPWSAMAQPSSARCMSSRTMPGSKGMP